MKTILKTRVYKDFDNVVGYGKGEYGDHTWSSFTPGIKRKVIWGPPSETVTVYTLFIGAGIGGYGDPGGFWGGGIGFTEEEFWSFYLYQNWISLIFASEKKD